jgi:hypothetical protein
VLVLLARARASEDFMSELVALAVLLQEVLVTVTGPDDFHALMRYILGVTDLYAEQIVELARTRLAAPASEVAMTGAERLRAEGRVQGEAAGRAAMLLKQVRIRFGSVSAAHEQRIRGASIEALDTWAERVLSATSVEDLLAD